MAVDVDGLAAVEWPATAKLVQQGLPARLLRQLAAKLDLGLEDLASPLNLTERTLHRRLEQGRFSFDESERLLSLVRIFSQATEILGSEKKAVQWLKTPLPALRGQTPLDCVETQLGSREVEDVLLRLADVVYA